LGAISVVIVASDGMGGLIASSHCQCCYLINQKVKFGKNCHILPPLYGGIRDWKTK